MSEIKFKISAPGRLVLSGEHTAAYGKFFLSTSIDLRTKLEFYELSDKDQFIYMNFRDVNLNECISLEEVQRFFDASDEKQSDPTNVIHFVKMLITMNGLWSTYKQRCSLKIFFFLLYIIAYAEKLRIKPFRVVVTSDIPIGAGLGGSTSFAVCLAACFVHWKRLQNGDRSTDFDFGLKDVIKNHVIMCEKLLQDYEYALVDAAVCAHGKMIKNQFTNYTEIFEEMYDVTNLNILLVDTKIRKKKSKRAKQMAEMKRSRYQFNAQLRRLQRCATRMENFLNNIRHPSEVTTSREKSSQKRFWQKLEKCILLNQHLLYVYEMSNEKVDDICLNANHEGYLGKLTGYSDGFVYILLPVETTNEGVNLIKTKISRRLKDFTVTSNNINCEGVRIDN